MISRAKMGSLTRSMDQLPTLKQNDAIKNKIKYRISRLEKGGVPYAVHSKNFEQSILKAKNKDINQF